MKEDCFTFSWNFEEYPKNFSSSTQVEYIDGSKLKNNLVIRSVRDDDSFLPLGMKGNKKVMKFLKDKKLSLINRKQSLVICNDNEIIWVAGHQLSEKYKIKENSVKIVNQISLELVFLLIIFIKFFPMKNQTNKKPSPKKSSSGPSSLLIWASIILFIASFAFLPDESDNEVEISYKTYKKFVKIKLKKHQLKTIALFMVCFLSQL